MSQFAQPMSDAASTLWALLAVYTAWRARRSCDARLAAAAGFAFGMLVLVRLPNVFLAPAVLLALPRRARCYGWFVAAGTPAAAALLAYNQAVFGSPWLTGYGAGMYLNLSLANAAGGLDHLLHWLVSFLGPALPLLGLAIVPACFTRRGSAERVLVLWFGGLVGFYSSYIVTQESWETLRFILPATPALLLGAGLGLRHLLARAAPRWRAAATLVAMMAICGSALRSSVAFLAESRAHEVALHDQVYLEVAQWLSAHVPPDAVILSMQASGSLFYNTRRATLIWMDLGKDRFAAFEADAARAGVPVVAALFDFELEGAQQLADNRLRRIGEISAVTFFELAPRRTAPAGRLDQD